MYKLPEQYTELQNFAEEQGGIYAKPFSANMLTPVNMLTTDRKDLVFDLYFIANSLFNLYKKNGEIINDLFCNDIEEGRKIFKENFKEGFFSFLRECRSKEATKHANRIAKEMRGERL